MTWLWLVGGAIAGAGAYLIGWPTWSGFAARRRRDLNTDRYLAWRGRAGERPPVATLSIMDRGRLAFAGVLALVAAFCLVAYFTYA
jgi:drug/metabolite transporter (DMT)-like permease